MILKRSCDNYALKYCKGLKINIAFVSVSKYFFFVLFSFWSLYVVWKQEGEESATGIGTLDRDRNMKGHFNIPTHTVKHTIFLAAYKLLGPSNRVLAYEK